MQIVHQDKDERSSSKEADSMNSIPYIGGVGKCLEGKHFRRLGRRIIGI